MNNPFGKAIEDKVRETAGDAAAAAVRRALDELDEDTIELTVGPITIPTIPAFKVPIKIDTVKG